MVGCVPAFRPWPGGLDTARNCLQECLNSGGSHLSEPQVAKDREQVGVPEIVIELQSPGAPLYAPFAQKLGPAGFPQLLDHFSAAFGKARFLFLVLEGADELTDLQPGVIELL